MAHSLGTYRKRMSAAQRMSFAPFDPGHGALKYDSSLVRRSFALPT